MILQKPRMYAILIQEHAVMKVNTVLGMFSQYEGFHFTDNMNHKDFQCLFIKGNRQ